jgi:hypothetical protein
MRRKFISLTIVLGLLLSLGLTTALADDKSGVSQDAGSYLLFLDLADVEMPEDIEPGAVLGHYRAAQYERFNSLVPWLLMQKQKGNIIEFEPDFEANAVRIVVANNATVKQADSLAGISGVTTASDEERLAGQASFYELASRATEAIASSDYKAPRTDAVAFTFYVTIGYSSVWGYGPPNRAVYLTLKNPDGSVKSRTKAWASSSGYFYGYFPNDALSKNLIAPKDRIMAKSGSVTRNWQVPLLSASANRATDVVSGKATKSKTVNISLYHYYWNYLGRQSTSYSAVISSTAGGTYSYDFTSAVNMAGLDYIAINQKSSPDITYRYLYVPGIQAWQGTNYVSGYGTPSQWVKLVLKSGSTTKATTYAPTNPYSGWFTAYFYRPDGRTVLIKPGDTIQVSGVGHPNWTAVVPKVTATANTSTGVISGKGPAKKWIAVTHTHIVRGRYIAGEKAKKASATGNYAVNFPIWFVTPGDFGYAMYPKSSGDQFRRAYLVD